MEVAKEVASEINSGGRKMVGEWRTLDIRTCRWITRIVEWSSDVAQMVALRSQTHENDRRQELEHAIETRAEAPGQWGVNPT